jgi:hypothetical protein
MRYGAEKMNKIIILLILAVSIAGCQTVKPFVRANISSFSELPKALVGKSIYLLAHPQEKNDTLEWKSYRKIFESGFRKSGFTITELASADYVAFISYGIDGGKVTQDTVTTPVYGSTGGGTTYHSGTVSSYGGGYGSYSGTSYSMPTFGVVGSSTSIVSGEQFSRNIAIDIVDRKTLKSEKPVKVYEGRVRSAGTCSQMNQVIDELVQGFFQKFPNRSGKVVVDGVFDC